MGAPVASELELPGERVRFPASGWDGDLAPLDAAVPGDISSAAFLVVAALLIGRRASFRGVGVNPTRTGFLRVLAEMGAQVDLAETAAQAGEPVGNLTVTGPVLRPFAIDESLVPQLIDEIPALVALASRVDGVSVIRGASELRVKESDRLALLVSNLRTVGVRCEELSDGLRVHGSSAPLRGSVTTGGDHRIAMAFGALGTAPGCSVTVDDVRCVDVSFPGFWDTLTEATSGEDV
jgi:3-phosphoshikimate 1-carboxyvinyltransferase